MKTALRLRCAALSLGAHKLFQKLELSFRQGEHCAIIGPNGAGKTSLLRLLSGELKPQDAQLHIHGICSQQWSMRSLSQHRAVLRQQQQLSFDYSAESVIKMGLIFSSLELNEQQALIEQLLEQLGLTALRHESYLRLSGGEQQRVQLARVLAQLSGVATSHQVLLLDEPTSALDLSHKHALMHLVSARAKQGSCVISVIHDLNLAARHCQRLLLINQGRIIADGTPSEVLRVELIEEAFGYRPQIGLDPRFHCPYVL